MKKKLLFLLTLVAIGLSNAWGYDFSALTPNGQTLYYEIVSSTYHTCRVTFQNSNPPNYTNLTGSLEIPSTVTYNEVTYSVTSIGIYAFQNCSGLTSVTIPNSVTSIGITSFSGCSGLTSMTIPNSVTSIGRSAFFGCSGLTSVTIGNSVTTIGDFAFYNCSGLTSVTIPNSVTTIGSNAFSDCSGLTSVTIPNSVTTIGIRAFKNCSSLTSVTIPNSVTSIERSAFEYCRGLTSVTIPNSLTSIGDFVFYNCSGLTSVTIPNSVTSIGSYAFCDCSGLTSVTIPNSVTSIGTSAFSGCSGLTSVTIPNSVTSIGNNAFKGCSNLNSVTIPNSVTSIGNNAFLNINVIKYCGSATGSPWGANDAGCFYEEGNFIFEDNTKTVLLAYIGIDSNVTIPDSVTSIGNYVFKGYRGLTNVTIPNSVTSIGDYAFYNCIGLTSVTLRAATPPTLGRLAFSNNASNREFLIPCGAYENYYNATDDWLNYLNDLNDIIMDINVTVNVADAERGSATIIQMYNQDVRCDSSVVVMATANNHYYFDHWSTGSTQAQDTIAIYGDTVITAYFAKNQYEITAVCNDEGLGRVYGGGTFDYLDTITLTAIPIDHHHFVHWSDGNRENPRQWVVTGDMVLTAYFAIDTHHVSVTCNDSTRGVVSSTETEFEYLSPCTVTATAYTGFIFAGWSNGVTANPYTFAVQSDVELIAFFITEDEHLYTVTVVSNDPTMGRVSGGGMAMSGGEVAIHAVANEGYHFVRWNDNDTNADRTVIVTEDATYTAYFASDQTDGIDEVEQMAEVYVNGGCIVVSGAQDMNLTIYDVVGRLIVREKAIEGKQYPMPHTGVYVVRIGHYPAQKVVVIK